MSGIASRRSTLIRKALMAGTGLILVAFLIAHAVGNFKAFQGAEKFDAYSHFLREVAYPALGHGQALWIVRIVLLVSVAVHVWAAVSLVRLNRAARPVKYRKWAADTSNPASRTMFLGGLLILLYVVYHILHFTTGGAHHDFVPGSPHANMVSAFRLWPVALVYIAAQVVLGFHLYHGIWSALRTLGADNPRFERLRQRASVALALAISLAFILVPVGVLTGMIG